MVSLVKEDELFDINPNSNTTIKKILNSNVIIVDNLYKNPDEIRNIALKTPATNYKLIVSNNIGPRIMLGMDISKISNYCNYLTEKYFNTTIINVHSFILINLYRDNLGYVISSKNIHYDRDYFAAVIYLNTDEEASGGTGFYLDNISNLNYYNGNNYNNNFRLLEDIEMKYNRLVLYRGNLFHSPIIQENFFKNHYRIVQVLFFKYGINLNTEIFCNFKNNSFLIENNCLYLKVNGGIDLEKIKIDKKVILDFINISTQQKSFYKIISILNKNYNFSLNELKKFIELSCKEGYIYTHNDYRIQF